LSVLVRFRAPLHSGRFESTLWADNALFGRIGLGIVDELGVSGGSLGPTEAELNQGKPDDSATGLFDRAELMRFDHLGWAELDGVLVLPLLCLRS
jgi:hypothetical protein